MQLQRIYERLELSDFSKNGNQKGKYNYYSYSSNSFPGIRVTIARPLGYCDTGFFRIPCAPESVVNNRYEAFEIFEINVTIVYKLFNLLDEFAKKICCIGIDEFKISRLDYCCNLVLKKSLTEHYMSLLTRGTCEIMVLGSLLLRVCKKKLGHYKNMVEYRYDTFALKAYDKGVQLADIKQKLPNDIQYCIRFEIEANGKMLKNIMNNEGYENYKVLLFHTEKIAAANFNKQIEKYFKNGVYLNLGVVRRYISYCIEKKFLREDAGKQLVAFIEPVSQKRSIFIAGK